MTAPIWMAASPEVHSALLSSGPGPGSLLAAAAAWRALSIEYADTAAELTTVLDGVQAGAWQGPSAEAYVAAHLPYLDWLMRVSADAAATAAEHETAAAAYTTALAAMPTLGELAANHANHAVLLATNFFGINTIPITLNEADYARMWVQAATVMGTYHTVATAAVTASTQTPPAPQVVKASAAAPSPDTENQWLQWLQDTGYTGFYNTVLQPLINNLLNNPYLASLLSGFDPYLAELGNPLIFLEPFNIAFALGYPMDIGSYVAFLSETFSFVGADLTAAFASGNPATIGFTVLFTTVEAIGTIITDTIALLKTLLEQTIILLPSVLPLLTVPFVPLAVVPVGASGLAGLAGLVAIPALPITQFPSPMALAVPPTPTPTVAPPSTAVHAPASVAAQTPAAAGAPPPAPSAPPLATAEGFAYLVGNLTAAARRAANTSAKQKAPEPDAAEAPTVPVAPEAPAPARRRRRAKAEMLGRGYEYMDLEPEPAGLTTLPDEEFGGGPRMPMTPSSWSAD